MARAHFGPFHDEVAPYAGPVLPPPEGPDETFFRDRDAAECGSLMHGAATPILRAAITVCA